MGTTPLNTSSLSSGDVFSAALLPWVAAPERTGTTTPHSQLLQVSLGIFVLVSLVNLPHALSERFAEPTYAQALATEDCSPGRNEGRTYSNWRENQHPHLPKIVSRVNLTHLVVHQHPLSTALAIS